MAKNLFLTSFAQILYANQGWKLSNQTILLASPMPVCTFVEEPLALRYHPYITSAYFWTFSDPPTHPTSAEIELIECHQKSPIF